MSEANLAENNYGYLPLSFARLLNEHNSDPKRENANIAGVSGNTLPLIIHSQLRENYFVLEAGLRKILPMLAPYTRHGIEPLAS
jgi:hypothetical protein